LEFNFDFLSKYSNYFVVGTKTTLILALSAVIIGTILGLVLSLMKLSKFKVLKAIAVTYIEFVRGTPLLIQIWIIYIGLPLVIGVDLPDIMTGIIALSLNSGAYVAEIIRAGIQAIDRGQMEAARSLGMKEGLAMREIIIPQAFKNILPALGNEFISIIKESSMVSVIGVAELMYNTGTVRAASFIPFEPLIVAALIYFVITFILTRIMGVVERRLKASDSR